jgi:hypothetical protein
VIEEAFDSFLELGFIEYNANNFACLRVNISYYSLLIVFSPSRIRYLNPLRILYINTETTGSLLQVFVKSISSIVLSQPVDNCPLISLKFNRLLVCEFSLFIVGPISLAIIPGVKYLTMVELLGPDLSHYFVHLDIPCTKLVCFCKRLDQTQDPAVSVNGLSDHVFSEIAHFVSVFCEVGRETGFVATRWD